MESNKKLLHTRLTIGFFLLSLSLLLILFNHYFLNDPFQEKIISFSCSVLIIAGCILVIPFDKISIYIFDIRDYSSNKIVVDLIRKLRLRAILFNNISVIIFFFTLIIIFIGFYLLVFPPSPDVSNSNSLTSTLTIRIGASVLLIFLVQILFKVFKYLLRVAAFYNAKADAIEFNRMNPESKLENLFQQFTPEKYDISELQQSSVLDSLIGILKNK